ncbi:Ppx/GppA family phosphatase [bacterium]|nr:Ppx/GppA family phosphatase [bacterium]
MTYTGYFHAGREPGHDSAHEPHGKRHGERRERTHAPYERLPIDKNTPVYAALDLGTNNCRLMVAREERGRLKVIDSYSEIVRLGEGLSHAGRLSDAAMERTLAALKHCSEKLQNYNVVDSHFVATEACRQAANGGEFIQRVKDQTGLNLNIISHKDEAVLAFMGCSPLLDSVTDYCLMLDIGGGSTEMMLVDMRNVLAPRVVGWESYPVGVMSAAEKYNARRIDAARYGELLTELRGPFQQFTERHRFTELMQRYYVQMICCSGTVTTLGALYKQLPRYDRRQVDGMRMDVPALQQLIAELLQQPFETLQANACIGTERADFLMAGCSILQAACEATTMQSITIADRGVREGILLSLFQKNFHG